MKQFYYELTAPRELNKKEIQPQKCQKTNIKAQTIYSLISPGTEIAAWQGLPPLRPSKQYPRLMGYCNIAKVTGVKNSKEGIEVGDYILTHQSHRTSFEACDSDVICTFKNLSDQELRKITSTYIFHLGYIALLNGGYFPGDKVAIIAYGAIGYSTVQLVKAFGGEPHIFSNHTQYHEELTHIHSKNHKHLSKDLENQFDIVINNSNSWEDHTLSMKLAREKGTIVLNGFPGRGQPTAKENPLASQFMYDKQLKIMHSGFVFEGDIPASCLRYNLKRNMEYLSRLILQNRVETDKLVSSVYNSNSLHKAYKDIENRTINNYSAILKWD